jgi:hypothetical protein
MCAWSIVSASSGKEKREKRKSHGRERERSFVRRYRRKEPLVFQ